MQKIYAPIILAFMCALIGSSIECNENKRPTTPSPRSSPVHWLQPVILSPNVNRATTPTGTGKKLKPTDSDKAFQARTLRRRQITDARAAAEEKKNKENMPPSN